PDLRQLIQAPAPNERADPRAARVFPHLEDRSLGLVLPQQLAETRLGIRPHRPELSDGERPPAPSDARLTEAWRTRVIFEPDQGGQQREEPRQNDEQDNCAGDVENALDQKIQPEDRVLLHAHQRDAADGVDIDAAQTHLVQVRDEAELDALAPTV